MEALRCKRLPAPVGEELRPRQGLLDENADKPYYEEDPGESSDDPLDEEQPGGSSAPREYKESRALQCCLRCAGGGCWILLGLCTVAWIAHSISIEGSSSLSDAPAFSKTLIWRSLAHHTVAWEEWQGSVSPPPPSFT
jgi:hypothetical protein